MSTSLYFELNDDIGLAPSHLRKPDGTEVENPRAGEPDTINNLGFPVSTPIMVDGHVTDSVDVVRIFPSEDLDPVLKTRILPNSRIVETQNPQVANVLREQHYHEIDPPKSEQPRKPKNTTAPAGEED